MAPREIRYYFGRLNITTPRDYKERLLLEGTQAEGIKVSRGLSWGFFEVQTLSSRIGDFVTGRGLLGRWIASG
jgi:hypothetical protein